MCALLLALLIGIPPATGKRTVVEGLDSGLGERLEIVMRNEAHWRSLFMSLKLSLPLPPVDFDREMLVGVFAPPGRFSGYRVDIFSVIEEGGVLIVSYRRGLSAQSGAGRNDGAPFQIVAVPRTRRRVRFYEIRDLATDQRHSINPPDDVTGRFARARSWAR